jgi:hypothetical protein
VYKIAKIYDLNLRTEYFDLFSPNYDLKIDSACGVFTIGTMEQLGTNFGPFLDFLLRKQVGLCINVETCYELYDRNTFFDYGAAKYLEKRGYLGGYLPRLKELEEEKKIRIIEIRKTFGSFFHDGYTYIVWKPLL